MEIFKILMNYKKYTFNSKIYFQYDFHNIVYHQVETVDFCTRSRYFS